MDPFEYPEPIQPDAGPIQPGLGLGSPVTRQVGIDPRQQPAVDPSPPREVIQGGIDIFTTRNAGPHVAGEFGPDGTFYSDAPAPDGTLYTDRPINATDRQLSPAAAFAAARADAPALASGVVPLPGRPEFVEPAPAAAGGPPAQPPAVGVMPSDSGSHDPRDMGSAPAIITPEQLAAAKAKRAGK
jgi:hypothetical protein